MRYLSLFSGIEACTVAWEPLGWEAVAFAEYEDFPKAVLAHRFPNVPDLGDVTKITEEHLKPLGKIDVVVGGTPCQNLSMAGNRKGLKGEASSLFFEFVRIFELARKHNEARYLLWENVPGAFSTHGGHDFRVVLELLAGGSFPVPEDGWKNSGVALGPNGLTEWRVLDAQYFGVPQRRRRIFALLDTGAWWSRQPILFEQEGLRGHIAKGGVKGEGVAGGAEGSVGESCICIQGSVIGRKESNGPQGSGLNVDKSFTLNATDHHAVCYENHANDSRVSRSEGVSPALTGRMGTGGGNVPFVMDKSFTPNSHGGYGEGVGTLRSAGGDLGGGSENLVVGTTPIFPKKTGTLVARDAKGPGHHDTLSRLVVEEGPPIVMGSSQTNGSIAIDQSPTLTTMKERPLVALKEEVKSVVRRLTPIECERLQGFPDNFTNIPWNGKDISPDSRRYKALGNSMAVPVMRWIAERIQGAKPVVYDEYAISIALLPPLTEEDIELGQQSLF